MRVLTTLKDLRDSLSPADGIAWRPVEENRRLRQLAGEIAELARESGLFAEVRPDVGDYRPPLIVESDGDEGYVFALDDSDSVHMGTVAWLVRVAEAAKATRGRDYVPVLVSSGRLSGRTARLAYDRHVLFVGVDLGDVERAAVDVAFTVLTVDFAPSS